ncbi:MAG TPA: hypothetical protein VMU39_08355 [Solirubrobacteraceae bacterium]|nr:hypothetical protein [Solirubrobacteraceae bacterium]
MSHDIRRGGSMGYSRSAISSAVSTRSEQLVQLVYELLDAHADTEQLSRDLEGDLLWRAHLEYLRALQRVGREVLADVG